MYMVESGQPRFLEWIGRAKDALSACFAGYVGTRVERGTRHGFSE